MSLVGSLEDLGLGDILQIISLSRKSGLLTLRCDEGEGRIHFREGQVHGALVKGGAEDLRSLLASQGVVTTADYDAARAASRAEGGDLHGALFERTGLTAERLEELLSAQIESDVARMFAWRSGEFSFEIGEAEDLDESERLLRSGLSAQFLAMESTRRLDEASSEDPGRVPDPMGFGALREELGASADGPPGTNGPAPAARGDEVPPAPDPPAPEGVATGAAAADAAAADADAGVVDAIAGADVIAAAALEGAGAEPEIQAVEVLAEQEEGDAAVPVVVGEAAQPTLDPVAPEGRSSRPVIAVDTDLPLLEWIKHALSDDFRRVHIFQRSELATARVRQYLGRAELPLVLLSADAPEDRMTGARDATEIATRLRALSPQLPILLLVPEGRDPGETLAPAFDGRVVRPEGDPRRQPAAAAALPAAVRAALDTARPDARRRDEAAARRLLSRQTLQRLKAASTRMHDASARGSVLPLVMDFASSLFARVAMFAIRDGVAVGLAQIGLEAGGGPGDAELRQISLPAEEPAWFRAVLARREARRAAPSDAGDRRLAGLLGAGVPGESYVAPVESGDQVVALLYADNLPDGAAIGDTTALEVILHQAGLALDRTALERALAESAPTPHEG